MDPIILGSIAVMLLLGVLIYRVLRNSSTSCVAPKSRDQKRRELIASYKERIDKALAPYADKPELLRKHKAVMLKELSLECSRNVFFGPDEVHGIIAELVHYEPKNVTA